MINYELQPPHRHQSPAPIKRYCVDGLNYCSRSRSVLLLALAVFIIDHKLSIIEIDELQGYESLQSKEAICNLTVALLDEYG